MRATGFEPILIWTGKVMLEGRVAVPDAPCAAAIVAVVPAHPAEGRDEQIAQELFEAGVATVVAPLLARDEVQFDELTAQLRHDPDFLAQRFLELGEWLTRTPSTATLPVTYIASGSGAAAAIVAAAQNADGVAAIVAIDGRTDLAIDALHGLRVPTLLVVNDMPVLRMNREALTRIRGEKRLEVVHGAGPEAHAHVAEKTVAWLVSRFVAVAV
jgi:putative phosphoribosyl transferase